MITVFPPEDCDHDRGHKFPFITSELFACERWPLLDKILSNPDLLNLLFVFLKPNDINSTLSGYFSKLVTTLIGRNSNLILEFISANSLEVHLASKIHSRSIAEVVTRILTIESQVPDQEYFLELRKRLLNQVILQLNAENMISQYFVAVIVNDLVSKSLETNCWKEIVLTLLSPETLQSLSDVCKSSSASQVSAGLNIFKSLLCVNVKLQILKPQKTLITEEDSTVIEDEDTSELVKAVIGLFEHLVRVLQEAPSSITSTHSEQLLVFGEHRLRIVEFFYACIKIDIKELLDALITFKVFEVLVFVFFTYEMNSILHGLVEQIVSTCVNSSIAEEELIETVLVRSQLLQRLCQGFDRKGYAGHAVKIACDLIKSSERNEYTLAILQKSAEWQAFNENCLQKKLEIERKNLGDNLRSAPEEISVEEEDQKKDELDQIAIKIGNYLKEAKDQDSNDMEVDLGEDSKENNDDKPMDLDELNGPEKEISPEKDKKLESSGMVVEDRIVPVEPQPDEEPNQAREKVNEESKAESHPNPDSDNMAIDRPERIPGTGIDSDVNLLQHEKNQHDEANTAENRDNSDSDYWMCFHPKN